MPLARRAGRRVAGLDTTPHKGGRACMPAYGKSTTGAGVHGPICRAYGAAGVECIALVKVPPAAAPHGGP